MMKKPWLVVLLSGSIMALMIGFFFPDFSPQSSWIELLFLAPIAEELLFRGLIQSQLQKYLPKMPFWPTLSNFLTSSLFAVAHVTVYQSAWMLLSLIPSLALGDMMERTQKLQFPMLTHALWNAALLAGASLGLSLMGA